MSADFIDDVFPRISVDVNWQIFQAVTPDALKTEAALAVAGQ
jgi:hypothetical protein